MIEYEFEKSNEIDRLSGLQGLFLINRNDLNARNFCQLKYYSKNAFISVNN